MWTVCVCVYSNRMSQPIDECINSIRCNWDDGARDTRVTQFPSERSSQRQTEMAVTQNGISKPSSSRSRRVPISRCCCRCCCRNNLGSFLFYLSLYLRADLHADFYFGGRPPPIVASGRQTPEKLNFKKKWNSIRKGSDGFRFDFLIHLQFSLAVCASMHFRDAHSFSEFRRKAQLSILSVCFLCVREYYYFIFLFLFLKDSIVSYKLRR